MSRTIYLAGRAALGLGLAAALCAAPARGQEETDRFGTAKQVSLAAVRVTPQAYKNVWIRFQGHYGGIGAVHNPFFTRFTRADFVNFSLWDDQQKIWQRAEYDNPVVTLFTPKLDGKLLRKVYGLQLYDRIEVVGVVRNAFNDQPWIEVSHIRPVDGRITTATLTHMARAWTHIEQHRWQKAAVELNLASSQMLTKHARGWLHGYLGLALMRLGRPKEAATQLVAAQGMLKSEPQIREWIALLEKDPRSQVDTQVTMAVVRKGERPMWEAVEKVKDKATGGNTKPAEPATDPSEPEKLEDVEPVTPPKGKAPDAAKPDK